MKKSLSILSGAFLALGLISFSLAQGTQIPPKKAVRFIGTVDSVTMGDPATGTKSEIVVVNNATSVRRGDSTKMNFLVVATTTLYNAKGEGISLADIVKGNEVNVKYKTTAEGVYVAVSVKVTK
ncbi:MAG: hypothetical protein ABR951_10240 [Candidatus Aminicenantales bacterium]|jgi:hypothetical protein